MVRAQATDLARTPRETETNGSLIVNGLSILSPSIRTGRIIIIRAYLLEYLSHQSYKGLFLSFRRPSTIEWNGGRAET